MIITIFIMIVSLIVSFYDITTWHTIWIYWISLIVCWISATASNVIWDKTQDRIESLENEIKIILKGEIKK